MTALIVGFRHDVEEERFDIVVEGLMIQEQLGQQAEVLTVYLK